MFGICFTFSSRTTAAELCPFFKEKKTDLKKMICVQERSWAMDLIFDRHTGVEK